MSGFHLLKSQVWQLIYENSPSIGSVSIYDESAGYLRLLVPVIHAGIAPPRIFKLT